MAQAYRTIESNYKFSCEDIFKHLVTGLETDKFDFIHSKLSDFLNEYREHSGESGAGERILCRKSRQHIGYTK